MLKRFGFFLIAALVTLLLLGVNMSVQNRLDTIIQEEKLVDESYLEGAPPLVAFSTVALGGFRGLIADILWFRTISLQDQGKYFELVQLASWITKLQPKFTGAAAYLGWNMAYNISVTYTSAEDRWRWIHRGIEVLREALLYNPNDPELYKELGWIYQHKLGNVLDDAQRYYKYEMARTLMRVYGGRDADWEALAAAPKTDAEFREQHPADDPLWGILKKHGFSSLGMLSGRFEEFGALPPELSTELNPETAKKLSDYLRAKWLRTSYVIRPEKVLELNRKYGDLDWLMPESFAIYWASMGLEYSPKRADINCDRMISQSIQVSFASGRMLLPGKEASMNFILIPNLSLADAVKDVFEDAIERNERNMSFKAAYENFLTDAIVVLYSYGQYSKAQEYFRILRREYKGNKAARMDFDRFVLLEWTEDIRDGSYKQNHDLISSLIFRSCILLGYGDRSAAESHLKLAYMAYEQFRSKFKDTDRLALPPFETMKKEVATACMENFPFIAERLKAEILSEAAEKPSQNNEK